MSSSDAFIRANSRLQTRITTLTMLVAEAARDDSALADLDDEITALVEATEGLVNATARVKQGLEQAAAERRRAQEAADLNAARAALAQQARELEALRAAEARRARRALASDDPPPAAPTSARPIGEVPEPAGPPDGPPTWDRDDVPAAPAAKPLTGSEAASGPGPLSDPWAGKSDPDATRPHDTLAEDKLGTDAKPVIEPVGEGKVRARLPGRK